MNQYWVKFVIFFISLNAFAIDLNKFDIDEKQWSQKHKVNLKSGTNDDYRVFYGERNDTIEADLETTLKAVLNFEDKCNNDLKEYRKYFSKKKTCKYHNKNLVETKMLQVDPSKYEKTPNEVNRYLLIRNIYNRGSYSHIDLMTVYKKKTELKQNIYYIAIRKLSDKQAKQYIENPVENNSVFNKSESSFTMTELEGNKTQLQYKYTTLTDHWLLSKSITVGKVFDGITGGIDLLLKSIHKEALLLSSQSVAKKKTNPLIHASNN
jgi:hypothetical protein